MSKSSGGVRNVSAGSVAYSNRLKEVTAMRRSGNYSLVEMARHGTGYVAIENSRKRHSPEEIEAAQYLASKGYKVTLKDEAGEIKTEDGRLFQASFEQRTPVKGGAMAFKRALGHAKSKPGTQVAVIYDKNKVFRRRDIEAGIKEYEAWNKYRFQKIIVVSASGRIHIHKHNDLD